MATATFVPKGFSIEETTKEDHGECHVEGYEESTDSEDIQMIHEHFRDSIFNLGSFFTVYLRALRRRKNKTPGEIKQINDNITNIEKLIECRERLNEFKAVVEEMIKIYTN